MSGMQLRASEIFERFMDSRRAAQLAPATIDWYEDILPRALATLPDYPTPEDLERWLASAPSAETARNWLRAARAMWNWAERRYAVPNPARCVTAPRPKRQLPRVFTRAELVRIEAAARAGGPRDAALFLVLLDTGIRIGELTSIKTESIEIDNSGPEPVLAVTVQGKTGQRRVPMRPETYRAIARIAPPTGYVFRAVKGPDRPAPVTTLKDRVRTIIARAGLTGRKLGPHTFRHTFATMYLRAGGDIYRLQRLLGHATIKQTMVYLHFDDPETWSEHARLSPLVQLRGAATG